MPSIRTSLAVAAAIALCAGAAQALPLAAALPGGGAAVLTVDAAQPQPVILAPVVLAPVVLAPVSGPVNIPLPALSGPDSPFALLVKAHGAHPWRRMLRPAVAWKG